MFEQQRLIGDTRNSLRLDTRQGELIENEIAPSPDEMSIRKDADLARRFNRWARRTTAQGIYNCAGHVWASRRTAIYADSEWLKIYEQDGYRELQNNESPQVGDLVVYRSQEVGFLHVGTIIDITSPIGEGGSPIPKVLSKWDDMSGEFLHFVSDVPFAISIPDWRISYWTDRK